MLKWIANLFRSKRTVIDFKAEKKWDEWRNQLGCCILCGNDCRIEHVFYTDYIHCYHCRVSFATFMDPFERHIFVLMETVPNSSSGFPVWSYDYVLLDHEGIWHWPKGHRYSGDALRGIKLSDQTTIDIRKFREEDLDKYLVLS